jgi:PAS domain-containing protein
VRRAPHPASKGRLALLLESVALGWGSLLHFGALGVRFVRLQRRARTTEAALQAEQARARVTLQSIGEAVITTDVHLRVVFLNPVAERLTQWPLHEALGRPLREVCKLLDESTMQPMATMVQRAVEDGRCCEFSGKHVALIRRDGSAMAIADSAAALKSASGEVVRAAWRNALHGPPHTTR